MAVKLRKSKAFSTFYNCGSASVALIETCWGRRKLRTAPETDTLFVASCHEGIHQRNTYMRKLTALAIALGFMAATTLPSFATAPVVANGIVKTDTLSAKTKKKKKKSSKKMKKQEMKKSSLATDLSAKKKKKKSSKKKMKKDEMKKSSLANDLSAKAKKKKKSSKKKMKKDEMKKSSLNNDLAAKAKKHKKHKKHKKSKKSKKMS
jgi:hypothetical protein